MQVAKQTAKDLVKNHKPAKPASAPRKSRTAKPVEAAQATDPVDTKPADEVAHDEDRRHDATSRALFDRMAAVSAEKVVDALTPKLAEMQHAAEDAATHAAQAAVGGALANMAAALSGGVDTGRVGVVKSGFVPQGPKEPNMTTATTEVSQADREAMAEAMAKAKAEQAIKDAAAKAEAKAKVEKERADKKAAAEADKKAKAEARATKQAENAAAREAARAAALSGTNRQYTGSMLTLAERVKSGAYVKGALGQLRCNDEVAVALDQVKPADVVTLAKLFFGATENPYAALNIGQQSMNWRNRIRGAVRGNKEVEIGGEKVKLTLERLKQLRDDHGLVSEPPAPKAPKATVKPADETVKPADEAVAQVESVEPVEAAEGEQASAE